MDLKNGTISNETIIVTGANGQVGTELVNSLRAVYGNDAVIATDINRPSAAGRPATPEQSATHEQSATPTQSATPAPSDLRERPGREVRPGPFEHLDVLNEEELHRLFERYRPAQVYHLAALLSATGEKQPQKAWDLNMNGLLHILRLSAEFGVKQVFWPSSIAVFGPLSPKVSTPQHCVMNPDSVYGISKLAGERWCEYYAKHHGLDVRSLRFPGLIGWQSAPGGGTTDYAVHIFHEAVKKNAYTSFLQANTRLPMMSMPDAVRATIELMQAPKERISIRSSYNIAGLSFTPAELAGAIAGHLPGFRIDYLKDDPRQEIADSWPESIDDSAARHDWHWKPTHDLQSLTRDMLENISRNRTFVHDL